MRAYFDVVYKKGLLDLATESATLGDELSGVVERRFAAHLATPGERVTANVSARRSRTRAELAEANYQTALQALRVLLNIRPDESIVVEGAMEAYRWLPVTRALDEVCLGVDGATAASISDDSIAQLTANRPDVAIARFGAAAAGANLDLARSNRVPNLATGPSYERDESGTVFVGLSAQVSLPIWNTGCPLVRQRTTELRQQQITLRQTRSRAVAEARAAIKRYQDIRLRSQEKSARSKTAGSELAAIRDAFENGQASIVEVLATQDNLIQERQADLDLLYQLSQAAVDVTSALAIDPELFIEAPAEFGCRDAEHE
jgi:outer membrane protein TolC